MNWVDPYGLLPPHWIKRQKPGYENWQPTDASIREAHEAGATGFQYIGDKMGYLPGIRKLGKMFKKYGDYLEDTVPEPDGDNDNDNIPDIFDPDDDNDGIPDDLDVHPELWDPQVLMCP